MWQQNKFHLSSEFMGFSQYLAKRRWKIYYWLKYLYLLEQNQPQGKVYNLSRGRKQHFYQAQLLTISGITSI